MKLFISYARENTTVVAAQIVDTINTVGYEAWFDHRLIVGQPWKKQILEKISNCDAFIYAMTPISIASEYCQWEYKKAVELDKPIIPILLEKCDIPDNLAEIQYVDFQNGNPMKNFAKLINGLLYIEKQASLDKNNSEFKTHVNKANVENISENPSDFASYFSTYASNNNLSTNSVFLATLGQRPEVITIALDNLLQKHNFIEVGVIHTHPELSPIAQSFESIMSTLINDYSNITVTSHEVTMDDGKPLLDISDKESVESFYRGILQIFADYKARGLNLHLLISGGRKIMSIYATLAASVIFNQHDRVWTIINWLAEPGIFHLEFPNTNQFELVALPITVSTISQSEANTTQAKKLSDKDPQKQFLQSLTVQEKLVAQTLKDMPYSRNGEIAKKLKKSERTIENQLRVIYEKLDMYLDIDPRKRRQVLLDIMNLNYDSYM